MVITAYLAIKLAYYDDATPMDYEPEGFSATTLDELPMSTPIGVGGVVTNHHGMKLSVATRLVKEHAEIRGVVNNNYVTSDIESQSQVEGGISCVCENSTSDTLMLTCFGCQKNQHGACHRVLSAEDIPAKHICVKCADDSRPSTDPKLMKMIAKNPELASATCLYRRILVKLGKVESASISMYKVLGPMRLHDHDADRFTKKLLNEGVIEANHQEDGNFDLCQIQLQDGMKRFLGVKSQEKATIKSIVSGTEEMDLDERGDSKNAVKRSIESPTSAKEDGHGR